MQGKTPDQPTDPLADPAGLQPYRIPDAEALERLRALINRIERLEQGRSSLAEDIQRIFAEFGLAGFDADLVQTIVRRRREEARERLIAAYRQALGL